MATPSHTPFRDAAIRRADMLGIPRRQLRAYLTPAEWHAIAWEALAAGQARADAGERESLEAVIERGLAHVQLEADYAEITAVPLTADEVGTVLASVPGDTSVVVAWPRGVV